MKNKLKKLFKNKIILVTGGTGSIGSEIVKKLLKYEPKQIRIYSRDESKHYFLEQELARKKSKTQIKSLIGDIRDKDRLDIAFDNVDIVFHAAALKHVPYCEYNPFEAIKTNINGAQNLVELAIKHQVERLVAISTDKAVYPNTIMGITKLMMERLVIGAYNQKKTKFAVVRFGNVLHSRGSVIPTWIDQINNGGPVTVTDKRMKRFFMAIPQAVSLVFSAAVMMEGEEIFVLKMPKKNIYELAQQTIKKYANDKEIEIAITGAREKEKLDERLYTDEETKSMIKTEDFFIILPNKKILKQRKYS